MPPTNALSSKNQNNTETRFTHMATITSALLATCSSNVSLDKLLEFSSWTVLELLRILKVAMKQVMAGSRAFHSACHLVVGGELFGREGHLVRSWNSQLWEERLWAAAAEAIPALCCCRPR